MSGPWEDWELLGQKRARENHHSKEESIFLTNLWKQVDCTDKLVLGTWNCNYLINMFINYLNLEGFFFFNSTYWHITFLGQNGLWVVCLTWTNMKVGLIMLTSKLLKLMKWNIFHLYFIRGNCFSLVPFNIIIWNNFWRGSAPKSFRYTSNYAALLQKKRNSVLIFAWRWYRYLSITGASYGFIKSGSIMLTYFL